MRAVIPAMLLGVCCVLASGRAGAEQAATLPPVSELVRHFDTIVFGSEFGPDSPIVVKWDKAKLRVSLEKRATKRHLGFVQAHLDVLTDLTGLRFEGARDPEAADIRIFFVRRAEMGRIRGPNIDPGIVAAAAAGGGCFFITVADPPERFIKAFIVVNVERDEARTNSCLLEELTQSLGLINDSDDLRPSIFSDRDVLFAPSATDEILLRTLYDPRMKPGMPRSVARKTAQRIIAEMASPR